MEITVNIKCPDLTLAAAALAAAALAKALLGATPHADHAGELDCGKKADETPAPAPVPTAPATTTAPAPTAPTAVPTTPAPQITGDVVAKI